MQKAIDVFDEWATKGKDKGMEKSHAIPVEEMIDFALKERLQIDKDFTFLDLGCGFGTLTRCLSLIGNEIVIPAYEHTNKKSETRRKIRLEDGWVT